MNTEQTDFFGTKEGVEKEVPKPIVSQKKRANPFVNKHTTYMTEETIKLETELREKNKTLESVSIMNYFKPVNR